MSENPVLIKARKTTTAAQVAFNLEPDFSGSHGSFLEYRKNAWQKFNQSHFPSEDEEAWRRTSIRSLQIAELRLPDAIQATDANIPAWLKQPLADELHGGQILITNSLASINLDMEYKAKGVVFTDLQHAQNEHPQLFEKVLATSHTCEEDKFAALAAAFGEKGVFLYVPKNVIVEKPLHSLFFTEGSRRLHAFQVFVLLEENASATFVHESASPDGMQEQNMHSAVMEIKVGKGARLNFVELQSLGTTEWNFTHEKVEVEADGEVDWIFGALGSHLTKNFSDLNLVGKGSTGKMSGFYFTNGDQHLDHDTQQNHLAANTTSDLLFKGALLGNSRSVWQGMIYVAENATRTDGYQANRNLVLSEAARADSIPGLEILTDDVRCTHGATVGRIDQDQVFYLESRGIPRKEAEKLIVEGFFDPIMQRIPFEGVRNRFQAAIEEKMKDY